MREGIEINCVKCGTIALLFVLSTGLVFGYIGKVQYDKYCYQNPEYSVNYEKYKGTK